MPPSPSCEDLTQRRKESQRVAESSFSRRSSAILCVSALRLVWFCLRLNRAAPLTTLLGLLAFTPSALAQPTPPHIGYVYPAGGRQGAVFQVAVGGQYLNNATNAYVSGPGVQAVVVDYSRPLTQKEFNDLREKLKELQSRRMAANGRGRGGQGEREGKSR